MNDKQVVLGDSALAELVAILPEACQLRFLTMAVKAYLSTAEGKTVFEFLRLDASDESLMVRVLPAANSDTRASDISSAPLVTVASAPLPDGDTAADVCSDFG